MTIDEAIIIISDINKAYRTFTSEEIGALETTLNVMRKYQKIQEIYQKWNRNYNIQTSSAWTEVIEVLEDGKID